MSISQGHKSEEALRDRNPILKFYYSWYWFFLYNCVGAEFFYITAYANYYLNNDYLYMALVYLCLPALVIKNFINLVQLVDAAYALAEVDAKKKNG